MEAFVVEWYLAGRSLRELGELTERWFGAVRNILSKADVPRRGSGASVLRSSTR
ncbi:helix-turn-helix domain-containing protein [Geodermatophilus normandii]|uniref:helix-turn-helix domain-containing protein n=1 Tax=Geodermatophilus normandii TaxID=1137989 RepID=UPI001EF975CB|nr:hypothetical protein [Geodermatophilus normandii]